ncbi:hypothetical protein ABBQ32_008686 [Trebouxia sp. C0010 RCD-2024]
MAEDGVDELVSFLRNDRREVRQMAVDLVKGLTGDIAGVTTLSQRSQQLLPELLKLISDSDNIQRSAITSLVNLCQDAETMNQLLALNVVARALDYVTDGACQNDYLLIMLLANVTTIQKGSEQLLQLGQGVKEGFNMAVLLKLFMAPKKPDQADKYEHIAAILTNVTRLKAGRSLLLEPGRGFIQALVAQLKSANLLRRQGCAAAFRNCCFSAEQDGTLEQMLDQRPQLQQILSQLCGVGASKEIDDTVRAALAESVLMLAETDQGRSVLWELQAPSMLKTGYEDEEAVDVCEAMERMAQLFLSDSGKVEDVTEQGQATADDA